MFIVASSVHGSLQIDKWCMVAGGCTRVNICAFTGIIAPPTGEQLIEIIKTLNEIERGRND